MVTANTMQKELGQSFAAKNLNEKQNQEYFFLDQLFDELFPICRSIMGEGIRQSFKIIQQHAPFVIESIATGEKVHDWTIPQEWVIRSAKLIGPDGVVYADMQMNNLHVVNYSCPIDAEMNLDELQKYLHSVPELPDAIPYVTSYYSRNWGFCLSHNVRRNLPKGVYKVKIDSDFVNGELNFAQTVLAGESENEFLLSSYLCHPSLANNELSGPLVLTSLYNRIRKWPQRRYTYRFVLLPETIGSISFLSKYGNHLKKYLAGGLVLTCLGGKNSKLSFKTSRRQNSLLDLLIRHLNSKNNNQFRIREFTPTGGSDERQYCSAGYNLPVGQMARDVYADYEGYHNSLDNKDFMNIHQLVDSVDQIERVLLNFENAGYFENQSPYGEPQLGRRGLYPNMNSHQTRNNSTDHQLDGREFLNTMLYILNYSDGNHSMLEIADKCNVSIQQMIPIIKRLEEESLLKMKGEKI
jgi:aminopeptidase-like protein